MTLRRVAPAAVAMLLAAPSGAAAQATTICHATGDADTPYQQIDIQPADTLDHLTHGEDLVPAPPGGCPAQVVPEPTPDPYTLPDAVPTAAPAPARRPPARRPSARARRAPRRPATAPRAAVAPAVAGGTLGATASLKRDTLPMTGQEVPAVALTGLGFLLAGAGLRLRYAR